MVTRDSANRGPCSIALQVLDRWRGLDEIARKARHRGAVVLL